MEKSYNIIDGKLIDGIEVFSNRWGTAIHLTSYRLAKNGILVKISKDLILELLKQYRFSIQMKKTWHHVVEILPKEVDNVSIQMDKKDRHTPRNQRVSVKIHTRGNRVGNSSRHSR
jgi:hypothetical protein